MGPYGDAARHVARLIEPGKPNIPAPPISNPFNGRFETLTSASTSTWFNESTAVAYATVNAVESLLSRTRDVKRNEKRRRGRQMMLGWAGTPVSSKYAKRLVAERSDSHRRTLNRSWLLKTSGTSTNEWGSVSQRRRFLRRI